MSVVHVESCQNELQNSAGGHQVGLRRKHCEAALTMLHISLKCPSRILVCASGQQAFCLAAVLLKRIQFKVVYRYGSFQIEPRSAAQGIRKPGMGSFCLIGSRNLENHWSWLQNTKQGMLVVHDALCSSLQSALRRRAQVGCQGGRRTAPTLWCLPAVSDASSCPHNTEQPER